MSPWVEATSRPPYDLNGRFDVKMARSPELVELGPPSPSLTSFPPELFPLLHLLSVQGNTICSSLSLSRLFLFQISKSFLQFTGKELVLLLLLHLLSVLSVLFIVLFVPLFLLLDPIQGFSFFGLHGTACFFNGHNFLQTFENPICRMSGRSQRPRGETKLDRFLVASEQEKESMLEIDPVLRIRWHTENIAAARQGGPHFDSQNNPDPRTADHLESTRRTTVSQFYCCCFCFFVCLFVSFLFFDQSSNFLGWALG